MIKTPQASRQKNANKGVELVVVWEKDKRTIRAQAFSSLDSLTPHVPSRTRSAKQRGQLAVVVVHAHLVIVVILLGVVVVVVLEGVFVGRGAEIAGCDV